MYIDVFLDQIEWYFVCKCVLVGLNKSRIVSKCLNFFSMSFFFRLEKSHFVDRSRNSSIDFMGLYFLDIYLRISTSFLSIFTGPDWGSIGVGMHRVQMQGQCIIPYSPYQRARVSPNSACDSSSELRRNPSRDDICQMLGNIWLPNSLLALNV